jgi:hypothetical protein
MTASTQSESKSPSRRALLAGALGGLGAVAATAIGRASPVRAADGDPVLLGTANAATNPTSITRSTAGDVVRAFSDTSDCLNGYGTAGRGVYGSSDTNAGVFGISSSGPSVEAYKGPGSTGFALRITGRALFSTSGVATINAGSTSKTITPGLNVTSDSFVLLTPKANIGTRALWFTIDAGANTFTIRMSSSRSAGTQVAWLLLG